MVVQTTNHRSVADPFLLSRLSDNSTIEIECRVEIETHLTIGINFEMAIPRASWLFKYNCNDMNKNESVVKSFQNMTTFD